MSPTMTAVPRVNRTVYRGQHVVLPYQQVLGDGVTPENIAGHTYQLTVRKHATDTGTPVLQQIATITDSANGLYQFEFLHADTLAPAVGDYVYDIQRIDVASEAPVCLGTFSLVQEVLYP